jgi:predicted nuclease of restriction endonuclease-like (RecB) superfamily
MSNPKSIEIFNDDLQVISELKTLIDSSKQQLYVTVNKAMSLLYWQIGKRINKEITLNKRAEYGKQIVEALAIQLKQTYGKGWNKRQLHYCLRFAEIYRNEAIVHTVRAQLSWSHIRLIIPLEKELKRMYYLEMCKIERWSTRVLQERINSMLYERTAISKKPDITIKNELKSLIKMNQITPDLVFKDPYFLDFLGLHNSYSEKNLESAILGELQDFIIELGSDFAFLARQKRITIDNEDYYIDLLFYHRKLRRLIAIDLKLGKFKASDKGQMELYLAWLAKHETLNDENKPLGLILWASKNQEHVELMQLEKSNIKIAEYLTKLPDIKILEKKLHQAIEIAKNRLVQNAENK